MGWWNHRSIFFAKVRYHGSIVNVTVNGARYHAMISDFLLPEIEARNLDDIRFQQDGATCHTAAQTMDLLRGHFEDQLFSIFGSVSWPPRSCDITPLDFFFFGAV